MSLTAANFGDTCDDEPGAMAANNDVDAGVVVIAASGNDGEVNGIG